MSEHKYPTICRSAAALLLLLLLAACGKGPGTEPASGSQEETGFLPAVPGNYDSLDSPVLVAKDTSAKTLRFYNLDVGKYYTLNYDGATRWTDKYAQALSLEQVEVGSLVDISFMHERKRLNSLQLSGQAFRFTDVSNLTLSESAPVVFLKGENYTLARKAVILTLDGPGELIDLNAADSLSVCGIGHTIYCLAVQKGHAYLRLENASHFVGGFIEVGKNRVYQITEDMLLAIPEGEYDITVSNKGSTGTERIVARAGEELSIDAGKWVSAPKYGGILFITSPAETKVFIDGEAVEIGKEVRLSYGIHQMVARAPGYVTISRYIRVGEPLAKLNVTLEEESVSENSVSGNSATPTPAGSASANSASENSVSGNSASGNSASQNSASDNSASQNAAPSATPSPTPTPDERHAAGTEARIFINAPEAVEVYKDGRYIGLSPLSFKKESGTVIITLRKEGYQTRSYTISMEDDGRDVDYSFSDLIPLH